MLPGSCESDHNANSLSLMLSRDIPMVVQLPKKQHILQKPSQPSGSAKGSPQKPHSAAPKSTVCHPAIQSSRTARIHRLISGCNVTNCIPAHFDKITVPAIYDTLIALHLNPPHLFGEALILQRELGQLMRIWVAAPKGSLRFQLHPVIHIEVDFSFP